jgi:hypothetical protein
MSWQSYNANPRHKRVGDCTVRAISTVLDEDWEKVYVDLFVQGLKMHDMMSSNAVWGAYLFERGFRRSMLPCDQYLCMTIKDFCRKFPVGRYLVCPQNHIVAVIDGQYFDTWDSGDEVINFYWKKEN